jgi:signal transduction histidine kinase
VPALIETGAVRALAAAREKGVQVLLDIPADLPPVWAHVDGLSRALGHVIENAVKFTPPRGMVTVTARRGLAGRGPAPVAGPSDVSPSAQPAAELVTVMVRDEGIGIPHDAIPRLFDPFYQVDGSSTREYGGTGLGLALTKRLVEQHGGRIWAESEGKWRGSTFVIVLPVAELRG